MISNIAAAYKHALRAIARWLALDEKSKVMRSYLEY